MAYDSTGNLIARKSGFRRTNDGQRSTLDLNKPENSDSIIDYCYDQIRLNLLPDEFLRVR